MKRMTRFIGINIFLIFSQAPRISSLLECNALNLYHQECLKIYGYKGYQWAQCYDELTLKRISRNPECFNAENSDGANSKYCWYPCQKKRRFKNIGAIDADCQCIPWQLLPACNARREHRRICRSAKGYYGFQYMTCHSDQYVKRISYNTFSCRGNNFCWFPCEQDIHGRNTGNVSEQCRCNLEFDEFNKSTSSFPSSNLPYILLLFTSLIIYRTF